MIDHNLHNWQSIDWQTELETYLKELAKVNTPLEQVRLLRKSVGRCIFLMQEYLEQQDYEYILHACQLGVKAANKYRKLYWESVQDILDAPQEDKQQSNHHPNCRCEMPPLDEQEDKPA